MMRHVNGDMNVGIAAISTRQRLPAGGGDGAVGARPRVDQPALRESSDRTARGSVGPNRRGASSSA